MPRSILASELQKKMEEEFSSGQLNQESGDLEGLKIANSAITSNQNDILNVGKQNPGNQSIDKDKNNYDSTFEENEIKIQQDNQKQELSQVYGTDEEDALINQYRNKTLANDHHSSPAKSSKNVRDSKNSVISSGSNNHITPKRGNQYIRNAFENNAAPRIPGDKKNYNLKNNQVVRLEKLNNKYVNNIVGPKQKQLNQSQLNKSVKKMRGAEDVDSQHIQRLQNWYQNRVSPSPGSTIIDDQGDLQNSLVGQGAPATNLDYRNMLAHYQQHMNNLKDQQDFLKHLSSSDQIEFKVPNNLAKKVQITHVAGVQNSGQGQNTSNLPSIGGPQINVHQHFNQPNITNFNQNAFYVSDTKSSQEPFMYKNPSMGDENRQAAKSHGGPTGVKRGGKRRLVPNLKSDEESQKKLKSGHTQQNAKNWDTQDEQPVSARKNSSQVALQGIKEFSPFDEGSAQEGEGSHGVMSIQGGGSVENDTNDVRQRHASKNGLQPSTSIDQAIHAQAKFFNQRSLAQKALRRAAGPGVNPLTLLPSGINRNQGPPLNFKNFGPLDRQAYASQRSQIGKFSPTHNPYALQQNGKRRALPEHKKFGFADGMQREDLKDQLLLVKSQLNNANDELTKTKTRNAILQQQLKEKDKFIDELLKSTYLMNQALVSNNEQLAAENQQKGGSQANKLPSANSEESASAYQQFLERGPYSVLKLKKKVADLKELLANKTHEHSELLRNIKLRKILELQNEIGLYSRECQKLRDVNAATLDIIRRHGLEGELDPQTAAKAAANLRASSAAMSGNQEKNPGETKSDEDEATKGNPMFQELVIENSQKSQQLIAQDGEKEKARNLKTQVERLHQERAQQQTLDKKKNEQIKSLQEKVQSLQGPNTLYADKILRNNQGNGKPQSRLRIESPLKGDNSKDFDEFQKNNPEHPNNLMNKIAKIEKEKQVVEKHLNQEKNINQLMSRKIEALENQSKQVQKQDLSKSKEQNNVLLQKTKEEKAQQQKQIERQAQEIKTLKKQIETQKSQEFKQIKTQKVQRIPLDNKQNDIGKLSRNLDLANKILEDQKKQIQIKEQKILELQKQLKKTENDVDKKVQASIKKSDVFPVSTKVTPSTKQRSLTTKAQDNRFNVSQPIKKNQIQQKSEEREENFTQSSIVNSQLEHERKMIEQKILNVQESDYDERSDLQFSQMQSQIAGITSSDISGVPNQQQVPFVAYQTPYQLHNDTIKEDVENEENDQTKNFKGQKQAFDQKVPHEINEDIATQENTASAGKDYLTLGKQKISASEVVIKQPRKMTIGQKDENLLINQLDRIPSESNMGDSVQGSALVPRGSIKNLKFVEFQDESVQLLFKRLGRALQLKRLQLDQIENVIPGSKIQANQSISIAQLTEIFEQTLALSQAQACECARFLIEEKDEDRHYIKTIDFDPNRKVNSQYIPVRLMTRFTYSPPIFDSIQEEECKIKFNKVFDQNKAKRFVKKLNEQEEAIISFDHFKQQINSQNSQQKECLTDKDIECAFLILSRGSSNPKSLSDLELSDKVQGFDSQNIHLLFGLDAKEDSDDYSEEEYIEDNNSIVNSDKTKSINESIGDEIYQDKSEIIEDQMGTFRSKKSHNKTKSDEYENDFEEEPISDIASVHSQIQKNEIDFNLVEKKVVQDIYVGKTAKFGDYNLLETNRQSQHVLKEESKNVQNIKQIKEEVVMEINETKEQLGAGGEFTFKNELSFNSDAQIKQDRYENEDDRSENDFEQQNSMNPDQLDQFKFGGAEKALDLKYEGDDKQIIREQSNENLLQDKNDEEKQTPPIQNEQFELPLDSERPVEPQVEVQSTEDQNLNQKLVTLNSQNLNTEKNVETTNLFQKTDIEYYDEEDPEADNQEADQDVSVPTPEQVTSPKQDKIQMDLKQEIAQKMGADGLNELKIQGDGNQEMYDEDEKEGNLKSDVDSVKKATLEQDLKEQDQIQVKPLFDKVLESVGPVKFTQDQIALLNEILFQILNKKMKDENLYNHIDQTQVNQLINTASGLFQNVAGIIITNFSELADSCRDIFREIIFSEVTQAGTFATKTSNTSLNIPVKNECEVLKIEEFVYKIDELLHPNKLNTQQTSGLQILMTLKNHQGHLLYTDLAKIFQPMGIMDYKVPKGQNNSQQLNYEILDLRSVRLINRMIHYLGSSQEEGTHKQVSFSDFMSDIVERQAVKTKSGSKDAEIFLAKKFFQKLHEAGIKKNNLIHPNLCIFLCIDQKYKNYLMLKKLKRMIIDFNQSMYFQSVGLKKQKLVEPAEAYEYYDEEDNAQSIKAISQPPQSVVNDINASSQRDYSNLKIPLQNSTGPSHAEEGYEYYDEEDPEEIEKASQKLEAQSKEVEKIKVQALQHVPAQPLLTQPLKTQVSQPARALAASAAKASPVASAGQDSKANVVVDKDSNQYEYYDEEDDGN